MAQPGRKSAAANLVSLASTARPTRLTPPASLTKTEQSTFNALVVANPHLTITDGLLLAGFVRASSMMLDRKSEAGEWEKASRVAITLATKLRLTPQSTQDPQALGRRRKDHHPSPIEEYFANNPDDGDDGSP
jgi:hypothetical protein